MLTLVAMLTLLPDRGPQHLAITCLVLNLSRLVFNLSRLGLGSYTALLSSNPKFGSINCFWWIFHRHASHRLSLTHSVIDL